MIIGNKTIAAILSANFYSNHFERQQVSRGYLHTQSQLWNQENHLLNRSKSKINTRE